MLERKYMIRHKRTDKQSSIIGSFVTTHLFLFTCSAREYDRNNWDEKKAFRSLFKLSSWYWILLAIIIQFPFLAYLPIPSVQLLHYFAQQTCIQAQYITLILTAKAFFTITTSHKNKNETTKNPFCHFFSAYLLSFSAP